jgi:hypothetical protein
MHNLCQNRESAGVHTASDLHGCAGQASPSQGGGCRHSAKVGSDRRTTLSRTQAEADNRVVLGLVTHWSRIGWRPVKARHDG